MLFGTVQASFADSDSETGASGGSKVMIKNGVELICTAATKDLVWDCGGGRVFNSARTHERVAGWPTCKNSQGTDVEHYTRARFEVVLTGEVQGDSGREFGAGRVRAVGKWVDADRVASSIARGYYGT